MKCKTWFFCIVTLVYTNSVFAALPLGKKPAVFTLEDKCGGRLDGTPWSSSEVGGVVTAVFYVDPDESDANEPLYQALKKAGFPDGTVKSIAIINMRATWKPAGIISMILKRKQKKYSKTLYVVDNCKNGIDCWNFADNASNVLLFNQQGEVIFCCDGALTEKQVKEVVALVWKTSGKKKPDHAGLE